MLENKDQSDEQNFFIVFSVTNELGTQNNCFTKNDDWWNIFGD